MVRIECIDAGGRMIAATGDEVEFGGTVEVDAELAGRPPKGEPGDDDHDPGAGLLAQVDVWRAVKGKRTGVQPADDDAAPADEE